MCRTPVRAACRTSLAATLFHVRYAPRNACRLVPAHTQAPYAHTFGLRFGRMFVEFSLSAIVSFMAKETVLIDDIDNSVREGVESVRFSLNGRSYSIDLGESNRNKLEKALAPFIEHAVSGTPAAPVKKRGGTSVPSKEIRAWAAENGHEVSPRGVIHKDIIAAYNEANGTSY
jgi:Lsr2